MTQALLGFLQGALLAAAALFPIVNPLGIAPIFLTLSQGLSDDQRRTLAGKVALNGVILLLASLLVGDVVLRFFGVSVPVVQIAGGLVVASLGWRLLNAPDQDPSEHKPESYASMEAKALYPLTLPLTVGPGSISVAITLGANFPSTPQPFLWDVASATLGILLVGLSIYVSFAYADVVTRRLGPRGLAMVMRLTAFILLCIGVQIVWNGIDALFNVSEWIESR